MAVSVTGGGGASGTSAAISAYDPLNVVLFTTPETANVLYIIDYNWAIDLGAIGDISDEAATADKQIIRNNHMEYIGKGRRLAGPSTTVSITVHNHTGNSRTCGYSYTYVAITMNTS